VLVTAGFFYREAITMSLKSWLAALLIAIFTLGCGGEPPRGQFKDKDRPVPPEKDKEKEKK
jgi:hypothetical protein